jgi:hypothetical protein
VVRSRRDGQLLFLVGSSTAASGGRQVGTWGRKTLCGKWFRAELQNIRRLTNRKIKGGSKIGSRVL